MPGEHRRHIARRGKKRTRGDTGAKTRRDTRTKISMVLFSPDALDSAIVTTNFRVEFYSVPLCHIVDKVNGANKAHHALAAASRQHFLGIEGRIYISNSRKSRTE